MTVLSQSCAAPMVRRRDHGVRSDGPHGRRLAAGALVPAIHQGAWWLDAVGGSVCGGVTAHQARFRDLRAVPGTRGGVSGRRCMGGPFLVFWARDRAGVQQGDGANVPALCLITPTAGHVTHGPAAAPPGRDSSRGQARQTQVTRFCPIVGGGGTVRPGNGRAGHRLRKEPRSR